VTAFAGAVLCGGASRRMGRDKALVPVAGRALALRVADALRRAGAADVTAVGGDLAALGALGLPGVPDEAPGEGPLGGVLTALAAAAAGRPVVFVAACDLVQPDPAAVGATVAALDADPAGDVAVPVVGGRRQWMHAAWRTRAAPPLAAAFAAGERAVHAAVAAAGLRVVDVAVAPAAVADADTPRALDVLGPAPPRGADQA
jgi:molybdopterin-guanine dinucleotide biosynthesis protein A